MPARPDTANYRALFLNDVPMMDMRAPAEFIHGAFPLCPQPATDDR